MVSPESDTGRRLFFLVLHRPQIVPCRWGAEGIHVIAFVYDLCYAYLDYLNPEIRLHQARDDGCDFKIL